MLESTRRTLLRAAASLLLVAAIPVPSAGSVRAQGITTAAIRGTVRLGDGGPADGAEVSVRNISTGFVVEAAVRKGRFLIQGLEPGGPYSITLRRIGSLPQRLEGLVLSLGEPRELDFLLEPATVTLDSIEAVPTRGFLPANTHGGTATTLTDSVVHTLPTLNRDVYDFVRLVPQISTRVGLGSGGISGAGVGFRFNNFLTNGVPERSLSGGQPPEFAGGKSIPLEAVREYQVLVAPFDVRYGDFAGAAVNTVTRSGSNRLEGSLFAQSRSDALARSDAGLPAYERWVYGASLSGPIRRDRVHFLLAAEFQWLTAPMPGPYLGQLADAAAPLVVRESDLDRLAALMRLRGLESGSGGAVPNKTPLRNLFARIDATLPVAGTRAVLWASESAVDNLAFARATRDTTFALTSQAATSEVRNRTLALQFQTALRRGGGGHNEFFLSHRSSRSGWSPAVRQPVVSVSLPAATGGGVVSVLTGTPVQAHGTDDRARSFDLRDNLTLPLGASHVATVGVEAEWFRIAPGAQLNAWGAWDFASLDSLAAGLADRYEVTRDLGSATTPLTGAQYALYAGDRWSIGPRLSLTLGLRADLMTFRRQAPYSRAVDSIFGRRTDVWPAEKVQLSPRVGFTWDPEGAGRDRLRGGVGLFTGRPPLAWYHTPLRNYGFGTGTLRCGTGTGVQGPPPAFEADPMAAPSACGDGAAVTPAGDVELLDSKLRSARTLRAAFAWDHWFSGGLLGTLEALLTWNRSDFLFENLNLEGPQSVDGRGRVLYGSVGATGRATPALRTGLFPSVIDLQPVSANHSVQLSARIEKQFTAGLSMLATYSWSRVRDVQTPLRVNNRGVVNWSSRVLSGRHDDRSAGISSNDIPHRVVVAGSWRAPWRRWSTELSLLYVGESGSPFTYRTFGSRGLGDLNADGSNANDPVYVPRDASDPSEILFTGLSLDAGADNSPAAQEARVRARQAAFEQFIEDTPCLRRQRGAILARNSCREPWSHTTVFSARQQLPLGGRTLELQFDLYNLLNLVNGTWGRRLVANPALLEHVGQASNGTTPPEPVFRFDAPASPWTTVPAESAFQLQLGLRYRF